MSTYSLRRAVAEWQVIADQLTVDGHCVAAAAVRSALRDVTSARPDHVVEIQGLTQARYDAILRAEAAIRHSQDPS